ncbi:hypothetical protein Pint_28746 [Pistacia integerrima]|uniref:Uncharacterized protein n=1 Tax=Pistacia integerrima TaxID=434235 RepID=A0ACC0YN61_9ROSI|nr:hypothetical protein Pint_28746 [Pistacia integerrima]
MTSFSRVLLSHQKPFSSSAPPPESVTLEESDFVLVLAVLLCALICVVGLVAAARCAWRRRRNANRPSSAANKGVKKKLAALSSTDCAICLGEFAEGDEMRMLPQCGHGFHVVCIDKWLASHSSCPSCRQILVVARCKNCGGGGGASVTEAQVKAEEDSASNANNNNNNNVFLP